jgi:hypothetical protein
MERTLEPVTETPVASVDAQALVKAVLEANRALNASITLRLFTGEQSYDADIGGRLKNVLGEAGPQLVDDFTDAKKALTRALVERCSVTRQAAQEQLAILLACGALAVEDDWYTLKDLDVGQVRTKVDRIDSARLQADGSVWGYLHVSPQERCGESWQFTWRDGELTVRSRD